eukprot:MONOS_15483.1-p1 / transcript=MONOS_15483.1 / gene=MONOS_15483 / organism=Monocercomonoides_exilis_PA203 / gene_product=unspecified product / transcript_product=unspecified product / location=Mono_scaffold01245:11838-13382(+) / protein_length=498 / sequence_SO=supercontig / SO=protein_coding / is_pseudo=false
MFFEFKGILFEGADDCITFDIQANSFLHFDYCMLMRKRGTFEITNTTLNIEKRDNNCDMTMMSLVKMEGDHSSLLVRNSEWKNIVFFWSGSIVRNGKGSFEGIKKCVISNITMKIIKTDEMTFEKVSMMKTSSMEDCRVESSMNVLEGGIVSGTEGSIAFSCNNCTFIHNERVDWRVGNTERNSTTQTQTYKNAEWNECSAPCGGALYVHDNSDAILTVENSTFVKCNATSTRGGGIFALNIAECLMKHSTFIECFSFSESPGGGGAGAEIEGMTSQVFVEDCLFKDDLSGDDAGGLGIWSSKTTKTKDCVFGCIFKNCSCQLTLSSYGGGFIHWNPVDRVVARNCHFENCQSMQYGGGMCLIVSTFGHEILWFCFFHNNTAPLGNDIYVHDNSQSPQTVFCYSTRTEGVRYFAYGIDKSEWLPNNGGKCRFVASTQNQTKAKDTFSCGLNESCACLTISHCLTQMIVGFVEEIKVLGGTVVEGKGVDIGEKTISVSG